MNDIRNEDFEQASAVLELAPEAAPETAPVLAGFKPVATEGETVYGQDEAFSADEVH